MGQQGIPLFYLQGMGGGTLKFRDLFNDNSLFWAWRRFLGLTPAGKNGVEQNGRYVLSINNGIDGIMDNIKSNAPRIFIGVLNYPCEIITRLDVFSNNADTYAELFITKNPIGFGSNLNFTIGRYVDRIEVFNTSIYQAGVANTTLPIWLRIRLGCSSYSGLNAYFDYSEDGMNWTNLWVDNADPNRFSVNPPAVGLMVRNISPSYNAVTAEFDHFRMRPKSIN